MTQSSPQPPEPAVGPDDAKAGANADAVDRRGRLVRLAREGRTRWVALGLVVLVGGGAVAVAAAEHDHGRREHARARLAAEGRGHHRGELPFDGRTGPKHSKEGKPGAGVPGWPDKAGPGAGSRAGGARKAPVALPALPAAQALEKAVAAVSGGKAEALRVVPQEGGGSAWQAVVLGPDGVRHAVTLSGEDGTVTGNTPVTGKGPRSPS
ncbi:hypothetical protein ABZ128_26035 [Streptomyces sp. NPDC006326]|uniref:hypothetical protein n=1 Tax=Streptomyces sp. NPDC006326 TaxID=3156752 RepID=UPI0033B588AC